jgi:hypothetical protein
MPTAENLVITLEDQGKDRGRYVARLPDLPEAELTFKRKPGGVIVIDHTGVPPELEGRGIGSALAKRVIADARALGLKIEPRCSFIVAQFQRHPEWNDLLAG